VSGQPATWSPMLHEHKYVDQVVRKEQFLADHPDVTITNNSGASPYQHWRGQVPGSDEVASHDLEQLLDKLDDLVVARDAYARWPRWTFTRSKGGWQAREIDGHGLVGGSTLTQVDTRVGQCERVRSLH
jgi:hypothetical protein